MTGMAFVGLSVIFESPWWWAITIVVLVREWSVTLLRLFVVKRMVIAADRLGKLKTTFQVLALGGLVLPLRDPDLPGWLEAPAEVVYYVARERAVDELSVTISGPSSLGRSVM